jgi:hypothetical protein
MQYREMTDCLKVIGFLWRNRKRKLPFLISLEIGLHFLAIIKNVRVVSVEIEVLRN